MWRFLFTACSLLLAQPSLAAWWDASWPYRMAFEVTNTTAGTLTNQQFVIEIEGAETHADYAWTSAGDDIRVVDATSGTTVSFYIRDWSSGSETAEILVLVPSLGVGETRTLHLYYGNGAATPASDPIAVLTESGLRYHTRRSTLDPSNRAEAVAEFNSLDDSVAGYGCTTVTNFTNISNRNLFSPPSNNSNIAFLSIHHFEVTAATAGTWEFRFGGDYGLGGGMYIDNAAIEEAWNTDLWWNNNWGNTSDTLEGSVTLTEGWHTLELIGFEGCCDGGTSVQYRSPDAPTTWRTWSTANIDIRSERCLVNSAPVQPISTDLSTSTHVGVDQNGDDPSPGDTIRYTVTLTESGGTLADGISVQLDVPGGVTGFSVVSTPAGSTDSSSPTGGAHGTGTLDISDISVPAGGSVTIVYDVTIGIVPDGTTIDAVASIDNPSGLSSFTLAANSLSVVLASTPLSDVIKHLYFNEDDELSRIAPASDQASTWLFETWSNTWTLSPALALPLTIDDSATEIRVYLYLRRILSNSDITITVTGSSSGTIATEYFSGLSLSGSYQLFAFDVDLVASPPAVLSAGEEITLNVYNHSGSGFRILDVKPSDGATHSVVEFPTDTAINIESAAPYSAAWPGGSIVTTAAPGDTLYVRSEVSDPFGAFDITSATIAVDDPMGAPSLAATAMTEITGGGWPTGSNKLYEHAFTVPGGAAGGYWSIDIAANEGTEGLVQHTASTGFTVAGSTALEVDAGPTAASTCFAQTVTVRAIDGGGNPVTGYTGTVSLSTTSSHGGWQTSGAGTLVDSDTDDGAATYTFAAGDLGEVDFSLTNVHADDLRVSAADSANGLSDTSAVIAFRDNRLQIVENDALDYDVIAGRTHAFEVQLWRRDTGSGNCAIAAEYDGTFAMKAWVTRDAADPGGTAPGLIGDSSLAALPSSSPASDNINLDFTAGVAPVLLTSTDVGKYSLNLRDDSSGFAVDDGGSPLTIDSASTAAPYVVRPFALAVTAAGNPGATTAGGAAYVSAGADFDVTVTAVLYDSNDDDGSGGGSAGDGVADDIAGLAGNAAAPSFGAEGEAVSLSSALLLPSGGANPGLSGDPTLLGSFSAGSDSATYQFNEVGIITIGAGISDGNYLGAGAAVTSRIATTSTPIGRFVPDHFTVATAVAGSFLETCTAGASDFTYIGETFGYLTQPAFTITPRDTTGTRTLSNYRDAFAHLTSGEITVSYPAADAGTALAVITTPSTGALTSNGDGTHTLTLAAADAFEYVRSPAAQISPFQADLPIAVSAINETQDSVSGSGLPQSATPAGIELRYGRLNVTNAFGPETESLAITSVVEYRSGTGWITNTDDNCSDFSGDITTSPDSSPSGSHLNIPVGSSITHLTVLGPVAAGDGGLSLSAPGAGNTGDIGIAVDLSALPWLQFDWDGDGTADSTLNRAASFGQYRGHDRVIYWREVRD